MGDGRTAIISADVSGTLTGLIDPCRGPSKFPGGDAQTIAVTERTRIVLTSSGTGGCAYVAINPAILLNCINRGATWVDETLAQPATFSAYSVKHYTSFNSSFKSYRVVSACVEGEYIHSSLENQGRMCVKLQNQYGNTDTFDGSAGVYHLNRVDAPMAALVPPNDIGHREFNPITAATSDVIDNFPFVVIHLLGCKTSTVIMEITLTQNIEFLVKPDDFVGQSVASTAEYNPTIMAAASHAFRVLGKDVIGFGENIQKHLSNRALGVAERFLVNASSAVATGLVAGFTRGRLGRPGPMMLAG
jgi:hypothetical protein